MKLSKSIKHQKFLVLLGTILCYFSTVDYMSFKVEKQRAERLELSLKDSLTRSLEKMCQAILAEEEATIQRIAKEKEATIQQIINTMNRYRIWLSASQKRDLALLILSESKNYQYDPLLTVAVIMKESGFNTQACSWKGARGLMQIRPATGKEVAGRIGLVWQGIESLHDPYFSIKSGLYYLAAQQKEFGDLSTSLAAYNHGPTAIRRIIASGRRVPQRYAKKVIQEYQRLKKEKVKVL